MPRKETSEELLRYTFTAEEKQILSDKLALACQEKFTAEEEKKSAMAGFNKRINDEAANISHLSRVVNNGWEMRGIICKIEYNTPVAGTKRYIREDTGKIVKEIAMSGAEYQDTILFVDPAAEEKLAEKKRLEDLERFAREFLSTTPSNVESIEPINVAEIAPFQSGEFLIAARTVEEADVFAKAHNLPMIVSLMWVDPDQTMFSGFEALYGDDRRSARAAIMHLFELGRSFPAILALPLTIVAAATDEPATKDGEQIDAATDSAKDAPAGDGKKPRKPRKKKGDPEPPPAA